MQKIKSCIPSRVGLGKLIRSAFGRTRSIGGSVRDLLTLAIYLLKIEFIAAGDRGELGRGSLVRLVRLIVRSVRGERRSELTFDRVRDEATGCAGAAVDDDSADICALLERRTMIRGRGKRKTLLQKRKRLPSKSKKKKVQYHPLGPIMCASSGALSDELRSDELSEVQNITSLVGWSMSLPSRGRQGRGGMCCYGLDKNAVFLQH
jgi:hypothetical protein